MGVDGPAVRLDDFTDDVEAQSQSSSMTVGVASPQRLEKESETFVVDRLARAGHRQSYITVATVQGDAGPFRSSRRSEVH